MTNDELLQRLLQLLDDMGWDYDRFSESGKQTYDEICNVLAKLTQ